MQKYRLGDDPAEFAHTAAPKKKIRGYVHSTPHMGSVPHVIMTIGGDPRYKMENASDQEGSSDQIQHSPQDPAPPSLISSHDPIPLPCITRGYIPYSLAQSLSFNPHVGCNVNEMTFNAPPRTLRPILLMNPKPIKHQSHPTDFQCPTSPRYVRRLV